MNPVLHMEAVIRLATLEPSSLVCYSCGKQMKSRPGYTLHQKKCKPDAIYDHARDIKEGEAC